MRRSRFTAGLLLGAFLGGCASSPPLTHTGFISDYSRLLEVDSHTARYISPEARQYEKVIIDPVESRLEGDLLSDEDLAEALRYFRDACARAFTAAGIPVVDDAGLRVARVRLALTDVAASTWWKKIHPVSRAVGAGTGGAAMEAELIDSMNGKQLAAVVQAATGNQFDITAFSTLADVKAAMDKWSTLTADRICELRSRPVP